MFVLNLTSCQEKLNNCITYCRNDEFSGEKTDGWDNAVSKQWDGCEGVHNGVYVREPLQPFQVPSIPVPQRAMSAKKDLH